VSEIVLEGGVFYQQSTGQKVPLSCEDLFNELDELLLKFPNLNFSESYWDPEFEYVEDESADNGIDLKLKLVNKQSTRTLKIPRSMIVDYAVVDDWVLPVRRSDHLLIQELVHAWHLDDNEGMSIGEILSFEYVVARNRLTVNNTHLIDRLLSNPTFSHAPDDFHLSVTPFPYQAHGINWLRLQQSFGRSGVLLADVMGLGKTLQAIGLIVTNVIENSSSNLVVCPGTLIENWLRELQRFAPNLNVHSHIGPLRAGTSRGLNGFDVVVTSYDVLIHDYSILNSINWNLLVLDEAQAIKNPEAKRTLRAKSLKRDFSLAITGTPLENRLQDLWSIGDFIDPSIFGSQSEFEHEFEDDFNSALEINRLLRPSMLRRKLEDVDHQLPELVVIDQPLRWPSDLIDLYEDVRSSALEEFKVAGGLVATQRLRKLATHPSLMGLELDGMTDLSPKYQLVVDILQELFDNNEKVIVFTSYLEMIDNFVRDLNERFPDSLILSLDGRVPMEDRPRIVDQMNTIQGSAALICNPIVAGAGLNITGANHVIHYNLEWNPAKEDQATARAYRTGQTMTTFVHRLYYLDTIDEVIDERIQQKRNLSDLSVDAINDEAMYLAGISISPKQKNEY
jgi:SNF2 family DNA or RNA helicase